MHMLHLAFGGVFSIIDHLMYIPSSHPGHASQAGNRWAHQREGTAKRLECGGRTDRGRAVAAPWSCADVGR